jgi:putative ATPase
MAARYTTPADAAAQESRLGGMPRDLFSDSADTQLDAVAPLAQRLRPHTLDEFVGQAGVVGPDSALRRAIASDRVPSMIFYGPPGSGKTTLARIVAATTEAHFEELSAVQVGVGDVRRVLGEAHDRLGGNGRRTILFLDEIHRFNKGQQDALLPAVESGLVTLIGATTENPYFEVNSALLSRSQIYEFRPLTPTEIEGLVLRALRDDRGIPDPPDISGEALEMLTTRAGGDGRVALAALERAAEATRSAGETEIGVAEVEDALQRKALLYDREGDKHYDYISAWIKATRGSDVDASIYYLAVMLEGGEDPRFIARRMVIFASEDIGNADPQALLVANAAAQAVDRVGLPECALNLAQAAAYLSLAPKSNASTRAISKASAHVRKHGAAEPPPYLQDSHYPGAKQLGRGEGYRYPHDEPDAVTDQPLGPESVRGERFYEPTDRGFESELRERLEHLRERQAKD